MYYPHLILEGASSTHEIDVQARVLSFYIERMWANQASSSSYCL